MIPSVSFASEVEYSVEEVFMTLNSRFGWPDMEKGGGGLGSEGLERLGELDNPNLRLKPQSVPRLLLYGVRCVAVGRFNFQTVFPAQYTMK